METVYLLLGSNLGDRMGQLKLCRSRLAHLGSITRLSAIYETMPWGMNDQPEFLNQAIAIATNENPEDILSQIFLIEMELGRVKQIKWGSRIIDVDILLFGDKVIQTEKLQVPHPLLHERRFALTPLVEIAPGLNHPVLKKTMGDLLTACMDPLTVKKL